MAGLLVVLVFIVLGALALFIVLAMCFRTVVETNEVHIVQSADKTVSYGKDTGNGNVYYEFPSWIPLFGVSKIVLPMSVFAIKINEYEAYDVGRLPFIVDVTAFFRIENSNLAAQRVRDINDLESQLTNIIQGSIRSILAKRELEEILAIRSALGDDFTEAVTTQLKNWGVAPVKNIELMDIKDRDGERVIHNIMEKKKSAIEKDSRVEVAENLKKAKIAEIEAQRETDIKEQEAHKLVGLKTVENEREVQISREQANQCINEQQKITQEKAMEVLQVQEVKKAEIKKQVEIVQAEQEQQKVEIDAEAKKNAKIKDAEANRANQILIAQGDREKQILNAQANRETQILVAQGAKESQFLAAEALLEMKNKESQGIQKIGEAEAEALRLKELAPISAQIELARAIGENGGYQGYLIAIRQLEACEVIGVEQAKAMSQADLKVIANGGSIGEGMNDIKDIISAKGGVQLGAMLEGLAQSDVGRKILGRVVERPQDRNGEK